MPCRATQDRRVVMESFENLWPLEKGMAATSVVPLENPTNSMKRQKTVTLKDELPRWVGAKYAAGEEWRNSSRKKEEAEPKQKETGKG